MSDEACIHFRAFIKKKNNKTTWDWLLCLQTSHRPFMFIGKLLQHYDMIISMKNKWSYLLLLMSLSLLFLLIFKQKEKLVTWKLWNYLFILLFLYIFLHILFCVNLYRFELSYLNIYSLSVKVEALEAIESTRTVHYHYHFMMFFFDWYVFQCCKDVLKLY